MEKIRVLVVDDSVVVRRVVTEELAAQPDIEVAGSAPTGRIALAKMTQLNPDLVILDIEMPEMDGLTALGHLHKSHPKTPVIMFSSLTELGAAATLDALSLGASDFFAKPSGPGGVEASRRVIREELIPAIRALCARKPTRPVVAAAPPRARQAGARVDVLAIGASTVAPMRWSNFSPSCRQIFRRRSLWFQHMPPMFTRLLAERLSKNSRIPTVEATSGAELEPAKAWMAPGDYHLVVVREGIHLRTKIHQEPAENSCRPAVDPLFRSAANTFGPHCLAVVLTGMGQDGLRGCEAIRSAGGQVLAQGRSDQRRLGMPGFVRARRTCR